MASADCSRSILGASDDFHANICGPCKTRDVERRAGHYCNDCSEYLCDHCKDFHKTLPLLKSHYIVPGSLKLAVNSTSGLPVVVVDCRCNKNQEVTFFCDDHQDVFCDFCKHTKHYKCKVSPTHDKGSNYTGSNIDEVLSKIRALKQDFAQLKKIRNCENNNLQFSKEECIKQIKAIRNELDTFLDNLEKSMLDQLKSCYEEEQKRIDQHMSTLTATLKMLESDYKLLGDAKTDGRKALMFAADVQVSKGLKDYAVRLTDIYSDAIISSIEFEDNEKLTKLKNEIDSFGFLIRGTARNTPEQLLGYKKQSKKLVTVKPADNRQWDLPWISGSVVMPTGEIVFGSFFNERLTLLDTSHALKGNLELIRPWDISVVDAKTIIVTLPCYSRLQYIDVFPQLRKGRVLQLDKECWGVHVTGDKIFTSCHNDPGEGEVRILDLDGNLLQQLGINQEGSFLFKKRSFMFTRPLYITVSPSRKKIFVSDSNSGTVTCMKMDSHVIYQYEDNELNNPTGLYCDGGDNILVCGEDSNNVQVITAEGKKHCELISPRDGLNGPFSISYRESGDTLIVGCVKSADVFMFKLGK